MSDTNEDFSDPQVYDSVLDENRHRPLIVGQPGADEQDLFAGAEAGEVPALPPKRTFDGPVIHDGTIFGPKRICPRGRTDCAPLSRCASPDFASFMCCGETDAAPVPTDRLRLCVKSTHDNGPVDVMVNFDERDATDTAYVLLGGLSAFATDRANGVIP